MSVNHYENFPVASILCPPKLRPAVAAIYWFARTADDLADEGDLDSHTRQNDLHAYRHDLLNSVAGQPISNRWKPVFEPLAPVIQQHQLSVSLFTDLLSAFEQDLLQKQYRDRSELLDYCRRSANPIGRLLLQLYGVHDSPALQQSDAICTALQLANFWQDLSIDVTRGRLYLPLEDCTRHGLKAENVLAGPDSLELRNTLRQLVSWTRGLMHEGAPLVHSLPGRAGWELRLVVQGGLRILETIERLNFATMTQRPTVTVWDGPTLLWRAARMRATKQPQHATA
ncbi:MAG: squalene synthase HpnC [Burkholderiales bacterium]